MAVLRAFIIGVPRNARSWQKLPISPPRLAAGRYKLALPHANLPELTTDGPYFHVDRQQSASIQAPIGIFTWVKALRASMPCSPRISMMKPIRSPPRDTAEKTVQNPRCTAARF